MCDILWPSFIENDWRIGRISRYLPPSISCSAFLHLSFLPATDARLIKLGAQPLTVRSRLMESTRLTDKPSKNKLSDICGLFIDLPSPFVAQGWPWPLQYNSGALCSIYHQFSINTFSLCSLWIYPDWQTHTGFFFILKFFFFIMPRRLTVEKWIMVWRLIHKPQTLSSPGSMSMCPSQACICGDTAKFCLFSRITSGFNVSN